MRYVSQREPDMRQAVRMSVSTSRPPSVSHCPPEGGPYDEDADENKHSAYLGSCSAAMQSITARPNTAIRAMWAMIPLRLFHEAPSAGAAVTTSLGLQAGPIARGLRRTP